MTHIFGIFSSTYKVNHLDLPIPSLLSLYTEETDKQISERCAEPDYEMLSEKFE